MRTDKSPTTYNDVYPEISSENSKDSAKDKVVFITGAGRGIGKATALAFAQAGSSALALLSRTKEQLEVVASEIKAQHACEVVCFTADVTDTEAVTNAIKLVIQRFGKLDVMVANAGVGHIRPFVRTPVDEWWRVMEVNTKGPIIVLQEALKSMRERNDGCIIAVVSHGGVLNLAGTSAYAASKAAVIRAVSCAQVELEIEQKSGVHLYSIHPGQVPTDLGNNAVFDMDMFAPGLNDDIQRQIKAFKDTPELAAWTCVYLASGRAKALRGRYLDVEQDIGQVVKQVDIVKSQGLYDLCVKYLGSTDSAARS